MSSSGALESTVKGAAATVGKELEAYTTNSNRSSHKLCEYALENVLLHQAAGQQLQEAASKFVSTGQQLLITSRQMTPQLEQLAAMAATAKQLRNSAEHLKALGAVLQLKQQHQQQQSPATQQQNDVQAAEAPS